MFCNLSSKEAKILLLLDKVINGGASAQEISNFAKVVNKIVIDIYAEQAGVMTKELARVIANINWKFFRVGEMILRNDYFDFEVVLTDEGYEITLDPADTALVVCRKTIIFASSDDDDVDKLEESFRNLPSYFLQKQMEHINAKYTV